MSAIPAETALEALAGMAWQAAWTSAGALATIETLKQRFSIRTKPRPQSASARK
jgi:hypothetical protein